MKNKEKSRRHYPGGGKQTSMNIITHPAQFFNNLPEEQRKEAIGEYKVIIQSNALSPLSVWFRQTKNKAIKEELDRYFRDAVWNEVLPL